VTQLYLSRPCGKLEVSRTVEHQLRVGVTSAQPSVLTFGELQINDFSFNSV
jgi:hypothetical protein